MFDISTCSGSVSPPYNMGLTGSMVKTNLQADRRSRVARGVTPDFPVLNVAVDKLRLVASVKGDVHAVPAILPGLNSSRIVQGKRHGMYQVNACRAWTRPHGEPGGIFWEFRQPDVATWRELHAVINPAKMDDEAWESLAEGFKAYGVHDPAMLFVDEYHGCIDYLAPRQYLLIDDRTRKMDFLGVSRKGPETERSGFLTKSKLRVQLYDKTAERRAAGFDAAANVTRYELMVRKPESVGDGASLHGIKPTDSLVLGDLAYAAYPGKKITVRCMGFDPLRVVDHVYGSLAAYARALGLRAAVGYARTVFNLNTRKVEDIIATMMPELDHSPVMCWKKRWPAAAQAVVHKAQHAWR